MHRAVYSVRQLLILIVGLAMVSLLGCSKLGTKSMQAVLDKISHSPDSE